MMLDGTLCLDLGALACIANVIHRRRGEPLHPNLGPGRPQMVSIIAVVVLVVGAAASLLGWLSNDASHWTTGSCMLLMQLPAIAKRRALRRSQPAIAAANGDAG